MAQSTPLVLWFLCLTHCPGDAFSGSYSTVELSWSFYIRTFPCRTSAKTGMSGLRLSWTNGPSLWGATQGGLLRSRLSLYPERALKPRAVRMSSCRNVPVAQVKTDWMLWIVISDVSYLRHNDLCGVRYDSVWFLAPTLVFSESLCHVQLFATPWTRQCMEFSSPEYWSG